MSQQTKPDPAIERFYRDAKDYCAFIDSFAQGKPDHLYEKLLYLLSTLSKDVLDLPFDMPDDDKHHDKHDVSHDEWHDIANLIGKVISAELMRLTERHEGDEDGISRAETLWDDISDIYRDLARGIRLYEIGTSNEVAGAIWEWKWGYENHWGNHLFRALHTVHEIRFMVMAD